MQCIAITENMDEFTRFQISLDHMLIPQTINFDNQLYYNFKDLSEYNPYFYYGCKSKPRTIIELKNEEKFTDQNSKIINIKMKKKLIIIQYKDMETKPELNNKVISSSVPKIKQPLIIEEHDKCKVKHIINICENKELININFKKCISGYHFVNASPINESKWEEINTSILLSLGILIYYKSDGSHLSGMDLNCSLGKLSNKSAKYSNNKGSFDISSYRLTMVCSEKNCGTPNKIIEEINRRKNFDYYSIIVRDEHSNAENITYDWLLVPSNYLILDPSSYVWEPTLGKRGLNKNAQVGWNTNKINGCKMSIRFSMSSQLWIHIEMIEDIKKFIIATTTVENKPKYNYIDLHNQFNI